MRELRVGIVLAVLLVSPSAFAQAADATSAQALFDDAKGLMKAGHYAEACPKLEASEKLDPGGGTLVALALCYEALGRTGSAWTTWNLALSGARSEHRSDRETMATQHLRAVEAKMPRARVNVTSPQSGLEVRRDGELVGQALWGTAIPIDPGQHTIEATAPGKIAWKTLLVVDSTPTIFDVGVPALKDAPVVPAPAPPTPVPPAPAPAAPPPAAPAAAPTLAPAAAHDAPRPAPSPPSSDPMRTWSYVVGGVSLAALATGAIFTGVASSKWSDAHNACHDTTQCTNPAAVSEGATAGQDADVASVFVVAGGIGAATAVILFLVSGDRSEPSTGALHVTPLAGAVQGLSVDGSF
jgi:hypothetical protein